MYNIPKYYNEIKAQQDICSPLFVIDENILSSSKTDLIITPANEDAHKNQELVVKIKNYKLFGKAIIDTTSNSLQWVLNIHEIDPIVLEEGENIFEFGFFAETRWDKHGVFITDFDEIYYKSQKSKNSEPSTLLTKNEKSMFRSDSIIPNTLSHDVNNDLESHYEATGFCYISWEDYPNKSRAIDIAEMGAFSYAKSNLIKMILGEHIIQKDSMKDYMLEGSNLTVWSEGIIKNSTQVGKTVIEEDKVTVRLRVAKKYVISP